MGAVIVAIIVAAAVVPSPPSGVIQIDNTLYQFFLALAAVMVLIIGFLATRTLKSVDQNAARTTQLQDKLFDKLDHLCEDYYTLKGEHNGLRDKCRKD